MNIQMKIKMYKGHLYRKFLVEYIKQNKFTNNICVKLLNFMKNRLFNVRKIYLIFT